MEIQSATYLISSPSVDQCPKPDRPEFAFIGRSNVGKSSLINMLCNKKNLARISATPGKTQMINHYEINGSQSKSGIAAWYLVDLPGYGFASVSQKQRKSWEKMIEDYIRKRPNLVNLYVLVDSRHLPQKLDIDFINQLGSWQIPFSIVFTKSDKNKPAETKKNVTAFLSEMQKTWDQLPPHFITSAIKKTGREELLQSLNSLNSTG